MKAKATLQRWSWQDARAIVMAQSKRVAMALSLSLGFLSGANAEAQVFVQSLSTTGGGGVIGAYNTSGTPINPAVVSGLSQPEGIAVDGNGFLYVAESRAGRIGKYTVSGGIIDASLITGLVDPWAVALDQEGNLYVADYAGTVGKYSTSGAVINATLIKGVEHLTGIAVNDAGDFFVGVYGTPPEWIGRIGRFTRSGMAVNTALIPNLRWNWGLACATNGHLFVGFNIPPGRISEYTASGALVNSFDTGQAGLTAIALDTRGHLFAADDWYGVIGEFTTSGATVNASLISGLRSPRGVAVAESPHDAQVVGGDRTAEAGSTVFLKASCAGTRPFTFQLLRNGTVVTARTGAGVAFELTNLQSDQSGAYTVVASNYFGTAASLPIALNIIPAVERRQAMGVKVTGEPGTLVTVDYTDSLSGGPSWHSMDNVSLVSTSQYYFDVTTPLLPQRYYRVRQAGVLAPRPSLDLDIVPAITLTGNIGNSVRVECINRFGPTDAWETLDTVMLTNTSQLYFDISAWPPPQRLYRLIPLP